MNLPGSVSLRATWSRNKSIVLCGDTGVPTAHARWRNEESMLESELFALLEHTADAAYTVTTEGEICSWNRAAEQMLGYSADEVLHRNIEEVLKARDAMGTPALAGGREATTRSWSEITGGVPNFDLEVQTRASKPMWVNVSTIVYDNSR